MRRSIRLQRSPHSGIDSVCDLRHPIKTPFATEWRLLAASSYIVTGKLLDVQELPSKNKRLVMRDTAFWKTNGRPLPHVEASQYASDELLKSLAKVIGNRIIVCLSQSDTEKQPLYQAWFTDEVVRFSDAKMQRFNWEIENQNNINARFTTLPMSRPDRYNSYVKKRLASLLRGKSERQSAVDEIFALGKRAVPSLVQQLEDKRKLPYDLLGIPQKADPEKPMTMLESHFYIRPDTIEDAVGALLSTITGQPFKYFSEGRNEVDRRTSREAWRVYLYYTY